MQDKTATQIALEQNEIYYKYGQVPATIETREQLLRWVVAQIQRNAQLEASPYIDELSKIEMAKPQKPVIFPLGE